MPIPKFVDLENEFSSFKGPQVPSKIPDEIVEKYNLQHGDLVYTKSFVGMMPELGFAMFNTKMNDEKKNLYYSSALTVEGDCYEWSMADERFDCMDREEEFEDGLDYTKAFDDVLKKAGQWHSTYKDRKCDCEMCEWYISNIKK